MNEIVLTTAKKHEIVDITDEVKKLVNLSTITRGLCVVYVPHASAAVTINENADPNLPDDIIKFINKLVPEHDNYEHDKIDDNAAAHIKSTLVGASKAIPILNGELTLGTWQNIFFCEFDGPRKGRRVVVQVLESTKG